MEIKIFQVDAFTHEVFKGNPAAICPLDQWLDEETMQAIASENNLSETAFFVATTQGFHLRWFTPVAEVKLCGHATLATAHVLFNELAYAGERIIFETLSGDLIVRRRDEGLEMDFPAQSLSQCDIPELLVQGLGARPKELFRGEDYVAVFDDQAEIQSLKPDFKVLSQLDLRGVGVTARGDAVDFVSRFFAPRHNIDEDPVTGSFHCSLAPFWNARLGKSELKARQLSRRGGDVTCVVEDGRVLLWGQAVTFMQGELKLSSHAL